MLDQTTKQRINACRDILVGKVPDPKSQVEQITIALIYKFMDDMDRESVEMGGKASFFSGEYAQYSWRAIFDPRIGGHELIKLYSEAIEKMNQNSQIPQLFRDIFNNAYLPYRDPETLKLFLKEINNFDYGNSERLGDAFEYLLSFMGTQGDAGQFRTPRHIIDFIAEVVDPKKNETVLDPACGTAGFLISAYKHILKQNDDGKSLTPDERKRLIKNFMGYDISPDMVRLSLVNLYLHGFQDPNIFEYDTLTSEDRWGDTVDVVLANPPFMTPKGGIRPHKRFSVQANKSEVLFIDYIAEHLNPGGRAGIIVPEGIIFQSSNAYKALRKMLIDDYLWAVVSLPTGVFNPYSGVKTSILFLDKQKAKENDSILFAKIENDGFDLGAQRRTIDKNDLPEALKILDSGDADNTEIAHWVEKSKIADSGDWNLSGERYKDNDDLRITNYEMVELGKIATFKQGKQVNKDLHINEAKNGYSQFIRIIDYTQDIEEKRFVPTPTGDVFCNENDLIMVRYGRPGLVGRGIKGVFANNLFKIKFNEEIKINSDFAYYALNSFEVQSYIKNNLQISGLPAINHSITKKIQIPLPPISVQEETVAEIDGYQKIIDGARQVVDNYKPTIKIDPEWEMVRLGEIAVFKNGINFSKENKGTGIKVLGVSNFQNYLFAPIEDAGEINPLGIVKDSDLLNKDDILFVRSNGNPKLVGRSLIVRDTDEKVTYSGFTIRLRFTHENIFPIFYANLLKMPLFRNRLTGRGANITNLNQGILKELQIPLPPLSIQREIVDQIEAEQEMVNANKKLIKIYEHKVKDKIGEVWGE